MTYLSKSLDCVGYRVKVIDRPAFEVAGFTRIVGPNGADPTSGFWAQLRVDGKLQLLREANPTFPWILGLGSWDPECEEGGFRYTFCVPVEGPTDLPYRIQIGASRWLDFEMTYHDYQTRFNADDAYGMLEELGFRFRMGAEGDYSVGLHFDAFPRDFDEQPSAPVEFWITVEGDGTQA